ncbi:MAG: hypothetical protein K5750_02540 [Eubacterium sp.]|nr:hypothetical protein [Eubacterium sp.]
MVKTDEKGIGKKKDNKKKEKFFDESVAVEMNRYLDDTTIEEIIEANRKLFRFSVMFTKSQLEQDIEVLDLNTRPNNGLRRSGIHTLGNLIKIAGATPEETSRKRMQAFRNLGKESAEEILIKLFYYQFHVIPDAKKKEYMQEVATVNKQRLSPEQWLSCVAGLAND